MINKQHQKNINLKDLYLDNNLIKIIMMKDQMKKTIKISIISLIIHRHQKNQLKTIISEVIKTELMIIKHQSQISELHLKIKDYNNIK